MKQKTKDLIALIILSIQIFFGIILILWGLYKIRCEDYLSAVIISLGVFLLVGIGRKEVFELFNLFK